MCVFVCVYVCVYDLLDTALYAVVSSSVYDVLDTALAKVVCVCVCMCVVGRRAQAGLYQRSEGENAFHARLVCGQPALPPYIPITENSRDDATEEVTHTHTHTDTQKDTYTQKHKRT